MPLSPNDFETIQAVSLVEVAHAQIRKQILTGRFRSGDPLRDSVLAEQMGISRSPVREALRLLERSGLVEKATNRSYRISVLASEDLPELAALRTSDERLAITTIVANRFPVDSLFDRIDRLRAADTRLQLAEADIAFHTEVVALARLPRLVARYAELTDQIRLALLSVEPDAAWSRNEAIESHVLLYEALDRSVKSGQLDGLVEMWDFHVKIGLLHPDPARAGSGNAAE